MKFTLKDYQEDAVADVLSRLRTARRRWQNEGELQAFSLTAPTGAGKTVMAAAVFEALFHGDDASDFDDDPGAVVVWFSDDPSLNEQTRFRLKEVSDRLNWNDLVVVENSFNREAFAPGKIYFLNTQKLSRNSLLVRGQGAEDATEPFLPDMRPDARSYTIWDTIRNTIEDPTLTLYLVLDEAHRGLGDGRSLQSDRSTIVRRLINGAGSVPPMPIVWGISATVERFDVAMAEADGRSILPGVAVEPAKVQDSGLLKDTIVLDVPDEAGRFDTILVRRATDKIVESSAAWAEYAAQQGDASPVLPLLVVQVRNVPDPGDIGRALDMIYDRWPGLPPGAIAHVFGEHSTQVFGRHEVPYVSPERVQESTWIRVLIAKDAISTGWDCPRAEVMVSFRAAQDPTHITQLLGRMVRTPLARRIPGNDRLNSVDCLLPFFDRAAVKAVANALMAGGDTDAGIPGRRVLVNPCEMTANPTVPEVVWAKFLSLPTQSLPRRSPKPLKRLTSLAHELSADGLLDNAGKLAHAEMHKALDAARIRYATEVAAARSAVMTVEGVALTADIRARRTRFDQFVEVADMAVIEDSYRRAARVLSPDLARTYAEHLAARKAAMDPEDALVEAHVEIAALGSIDPVRAYLEKEAEDLTSTWLDSYRVEIKSLSDERQEDYRQIKAMSIEPQDVGLGRPNTWLVATSFREADGVELPLTTHASHLMSDGNGDFPAQLNSWETLVLEREMGRTGFAAWYRNPSRPTAESLGAAYEADGAYRIVRPDFLFFARLPGGSVVADLIDPHGTQFSDALPKLRGLARYAATYPGAFRRIETAAKVGEDLRMLDLTNDRVRAAINTAQSALELYTGPHARPY